LYFCSFLFYRLRMRLLTIYSSTAGAQPVEAGTGAALTTTWEKMSKSKLNGVEPEEVLEELGCDATRLLLLADVAPTSHRKWSKDSECPTLIA